MTETRESVYEARLEKGMFYEIRPGAVCVAATHDVVLLIPTLHWIKDVMKHEIMQGPFTVIQAHEKWPEYSIAELTADRNRVLKAKEWSTY